MRTVVTMLLVIRKMLMMAAAVVSSLLVPRIRPTGRSSVSSGPPCTWGITARQEGHRPSPHRVGVSPPVEISSTTRVCVLFFRQGSFPAPYGRAVLGSRPDFRVEVVADRATVMRTSTRVRSGPVGAVHEATPVGINTALGTVALVAAASVAAAIPVAAGDWRLTVVAVAVGGFAAATVDHRAVAVVVGLGWLLVDGFLVDRLGQLSWHGPADLLRLLLLAGVAAVGLALGNLTRMVRDCLQRWRLGAEVYAMATTTRVGEEAKQHA